MSDTATTPTAHTKQTMDITEIMAILPHRYPFLLIDRIVELEPRKRIVAIKNVTATEPHFLGHFPGYPIMPGVLIVEAMAQAGGALLMPEFPNRDELLLLFTSIENAKFRRPVVPGDQVRIDVTITNWRRMAVKILGIATVDGKVVCEASLMCMLVNNPTLPPKPKPEAAPAKLESAKQESAKQESSPTQEDSAAKQQETKQEASATPSPEAVLS